MTYEHYRDRDGHTHNSCTVLIDRVPYPIFHSDSRSVGIRVGNRHSWMCCSEDIHDKYKDGHKVIATFTNGRHCPGHMYIKAISRA